MTSPVFVENLAIPLQPIGGKSPAQISVISPKPMFVEGGEINGAKMCEIVQPIGHGAGQTGLTVPPTPCERAPTLLEF